MLDMFLQVSTGKAYFFRPKYCAVGMQNCTFCPS